jgi:hypothetical protein
LKTLTITRFCYADDGTFGTMNVAGYKLYTVEQPWNDNRQGVSCIPEGEYVCKPDYYHRGGYPAIEITDVPGGRSRILMHKANWPHQLRGCIAPVWDWGCVNDIVGGPNSGKAFDLLMEHYGQDAFYLSITHKEIQFAPFWQ